MRYYFECNFPTVFNLMKQPIQTVLSNFLTEPLSSPDGSPGFHRTLWETLFIKFTKIRERIVILSFVFYSRCLSKPPQRQSLVLWRQHLLSVTPE